MPQGKMKVKAKVPKSVEAKRKAKKGPAISKRGSAPVAAKKAKKVQAQRLKKVITKTVNVAAEEELRAIALDGKKALLSKKGTGAKAVPKPKRGKKK